MRQLITIAAAIASIAGSAEIGGSAEAASIPNTSLGVVANGTQANPFAVRKQEHSNRKHMTRRHAGVRSYAMG